MRRGGDGGDGVEGGRTAMPAGNGHKNHPSVFHHHSKHNSITRQHGASPSELVHLGHNHRQSGQLLCVLRQTMPTAHAGSS